jgi:hypothetical protein
MTEKPAPRSRRDHAFVRGSDPHFGSVFGGGCVEQVDDVTCGWPESVHPAQESSQPLSVSHTGSEERT